MRKALVAVLIVAALGGAYALVYLIARSKLHTIGLQQVEANAEEYKAADEALSGIKELKVLGREVTFLDRFSLYAERHARETPFNIALARVKPKDKDSGDVERFRLRQITNRDGRAVALDRLTLRLQTLPRREGYWLDTGMLKTG